jgi:hypothetical protein
MESKEHKKLPHGLLPPHGSKRAEGASAESEAAASDPGPHPSAGRFKRAKPPGAKAPSTKR